MILTEMLQCQSNIKFHQVLVWSYLVECEDLYNDLQECVLYPIWTVFFLGYNSIYSLQKEIKQYYLTCKFGEGQFFTNNIYFNGSIEFETYSDIFLYLSTQNFIIDYKMGYWNGTYGDLHYNQWCWGGYHNPTH